MDGVEKDRRWKNRGKEEDGLEDERRWKGRVKEKEEEEEEMVDGWGGKGQEMEE